MNSVMQKGTIRDKVNGLVLNIQQSPFHKVFTLDELLNLAQSTTTRIAVLAVKALKTIFIASYLPDSKLTYFNKRFDALTEAEGEKVEAEEFVRWYYDDCVKARYANFIQILEVILFTTYEIS